MGVGMKHARLSDGRTLEFPDITTDEEMNAAVKRFVGKETAKKQQQDLIKKNEDAAKQQELITTEANRAKQQHLATEKERKRQEAENTKAIAAGKAREMDLKIASSRNESLSGIYGNLGIIAEGVKSFQVIEKKLDALTKAALLLAKAVSDSSMLVSETLKLPKQIVKNERGAITGIQVAEDEPDQKVH